MTSTDGTPVNRYGDHAVIGAQGQNITVHDGIHIGHETEEELYERGENNLLRGAAEEARELIWQAMMRGHQTNRVLFHWLLAMLSGRTLKEFSPAEIRRLREMRPRYTTVTGDAWAPGVRILSRLFDLAIPELTVDDPDASQTDLPTLREELEGLPLDQQDLIRPHLELFLIGPELDELWQEQVKRAKAQRTDGDRANRVWMYYQPVPKHVSLPDPPDPRVDGRQLYRRGALLAAVSCFVGVELIWHDALSGLAAFVAGLTAGLVAAEAERRRRCAGLRHDLEHPRPGQGISVEDTNLAGQVKKLFDRYIGKYEPDEDRRRNFKTQFAERIGAECSEVTSLCRLGNATPDEVRWLIRRRSCQLLQPGQTDPLAFQHAMNRPRPRFVTVRRIGLTLLVLCGIWTVFTLHAQPIPDAVGAVTVPFGIVITWRRWIADTLEKERFQAESERRDQRQDDIDDAFTQWSQRLELKPSHKEMGTWLAADRAVLLDTALHHFDLQRSGLVMHAFLEERMPWARAGRSEDGPTMYERYQVLLFLLVKDGVRMVKASLDFINVTFAIQERRDFRYDSIVAVRVTPTTGGREEFALHLTSGDPITLKVRGTGPTAMPPPPDTDTTDDETPLTAASPASTLHLLEGIAAEGQTWLTQRTWNR